jgi:hypothetical protein
MRRYIAAGLIAAFLLAFGVFYLVSKTYVPPVCSPRPAEQVGTLSQYAFTAKFVSASRNAFAPLRACGRYGEATPNCGGRKVTFEVQEVFRGSMATKISEQRTVVALTPDACLCNGIEWNLNDTYLIIARDNSSSLDGQFIVDGKCEGTGLVKDRTAEIAQLRLPPPMRVKQQSN